MGKDADIVALLEQLRLAETLPRRPTAPSTGVDPGRGVRPVCALTSTSVESGGGVCDEYRETEGGPSRVRRYRGKAPPVDPFADKLLLSEGVCRQLGIIHYHPTVQP